MPRPSDTDASIALGQAIRTLRLDKGITQEELAVRADLHPTYISMIESGRRNIGWTTVRRISRALGVSLMVLAQMAEDLEREA